MSLAFTNQKKPTSSLIPARHSQQDRQATFQPPAAAEAPLQPGLGHEFSKVDVLPGERTGPQFSQSCSLSLDTPRACPFGGACHSCPAPVQAKLTIGQPGDKYEQEADQVAEAVMTMPEPRNGQRLQRECLECDDELHRQPVEEEEEEEVAPKLIQKQAEPGGPEEEEEEETIAPKLLQHQVEGEEEEEEEETVSPQAQPGRTPQVTPAVSASIQSMRSGGQLLSPASRAFFEPRFGHDFSRVRVHIDSKAADTAQAVRAKAFTVGRDVIFGAGQYAPDTHGGRRLLAHELAHVVQQENRDLSREKIRRSIIDDVTRMSIDTARLSNSQLMRLLPIVSTTHLRYCDALPNIPRIIDAIMRRLHMCPDVGWSSMARPVARRITSPFGPRRHPIRGRRHLHSGIDIGAPTGTPIDSVTGGRVISARRAGGYGNMVTLDHGTVGGINLQSRYAHMDTIIVAQGECAIHQQQIGTVGQTGTATGPHLHLEIRENGRAVDPATRVNGL